MARGKGRLANALAKQLNHERAMALKKKKLENKQIHFNAKPKPKKVIPSKPFIPFNRKDRILLVGEGDFSYALSLISNDLIEPENLTATSFDSFEDVKLKYPDTAESNISSLKSFGVRVYHEIDGTQLSKTLGIQGGNKRQGNGSGKTIEVLGSLDLNNIIFNFPHIGKGIKDMDRNIKENQKMLSEFFTSARILYDILFFQRDTSKDYKSKEEQSLAQLSADDAEWLYLNKKKTGTDYQAKDKEIITITVFEGEPYDSWRIKKLARDSIGYSVQRSGNLNWDTFKGYSHKRTAGIGKTNKEAYERDARIFKFERYKVIKADKDKKSGNDNNDSDDSDD